MRTLVLALLLAGTARHVVAQGLADSTVERGITPADVGLRHAPLHYFLLSGLVPGWGQAELDRKLTGALFIGFEGLAISMALKTGSELQFLDRADTVTARHRHAEKQDWLVLIGFNHLFSALEAYVSAHLIDFPPDLKLQFLPGGRTGIGFSIGGHR
jgi:hypothetical protein